eukprot:1151765-Pelagomonas_calceolata.AAC.2
MVGDVHLAPARAVIFRSPGLPASWHPLPSIVCPHIYCRQHCIGYSVAYGSTAMEGKIKCTAATSVQAEQLVAGYKRLVGGSTCVECAHAATPAQAEQLVAGYKRLVGGSTGAMDSDGQQSGSSKGCSSSGINSGTNRNDSSSSSRSEENEEGGLGSRKTGAAGQDGGMGQSYQVIGLPCCTHASHARSMEKCHRLMSEKLTASSRASTLYKSLVNT